MECRRLAVKIVKVAIDMFKKIDSVFNEPPEWVSRIVTSYTYEGASFTVPIPFYSERQLGIVTNKYIHSLLIDEGAVRNLYPAIKGYTYRSYLYTAMGIDDYCFEMYVSELRKPIKDWLYTAKVATTLLMNL
jgi:hypothetical protein